MTKLLFVCVAVTLMAISHGIGSVDRDAGIIVPEEFLKKLQVLGNYIHTNEGCDEVCPPRHDAVCVLDCIRVFANGTRDDCVYHHYDPVNGTLVDCYFL